MQLISIHFWQSYLRNLPEFHDHRSANQSADSNLTYFEIQKYKLYHAVLDMNNIWN